MKKNWLYLLAITIGGQMASSCTEDPIEIPEPPSSTEIRSARDYFEGLITSRGADEMFKRGSGLGLDPGDFSIDWESAIVSKDAKSLVHVEVDITPANRYMVRRKSSFSMPSKVTQKLLLLRDEAKSQVEGTDVRDCYIMMVIPYNHNVASNDPAVKTKGEFINGQHSPEFRGIVIYSRVGSNVTIRVDEWNSGRKTRAASLFDDEESPVALEKMRGIVSRVRLFHESDIITSRSTESSGGTGGGYNPNCADCRNKGSACIQHEDHGLGEVVVPGGSRCPVCNQYNCSGHSSGGTGGTGGVDPNPPKEEFVVNLTASPAKGGSVSGGGSYTSGTRATITATPKSGYKFVKWTGAGSSSTATSQTVTVTSNLSFTAVFEPVVALEVTCSTPKLVGDSITIGGEFTLNFTAKYGDEAIAPGNIDYLWKYRPAGSTGNGNTFPNSMNKSSLKVQARLPGTWEYRIIATVDRGSGSEDHVTKWIRITNRFPDINTIISANGLVDAMKAAFVYATHNLCTERFAVETGYPVMMNTKNWPPTFHLGARTVGPSHDFVESGGGGGASVVTNLQEEYALTDLTTGAEFFVADFHTHPTYSHWKGRPLPRPVGPSSNNNGATGDIPNAYRDGLPGVVWDYVGNKYKEHLSTDDIDSPSRYDIFGPARRRDYSQF